jgi:hypothetical protein
MSTPDAVEWPGDPGPVLRVVRHAAAGAGVGVALLLVGAAVWLCWRAIRRGDDGVLVVVAAALAVLVLTGRGVLGAIEYGPGLAPSLRREWVAVAGVAWAVVLLAVVRWRPLASVPLLVVAVAAWIGAAAGRTPGRVDPAAGTLTYGSRTVSTAGLAGVRRVPLGYVSLFWLRFRRGTVGSAAPRVLVVPRTVAPAVRSALAGAAASVADDASVATGHTTGWAERAIAAALGVGFLLAGPLLWAVLPGGGDATLVVGYLTAVTLPFALVLLRYVLVV